MEKEKTRSEINDQYKWDVDTNITDFDKEIKNVEKLTKKLEDCKGKITETSDSLYQFLIDNENITSKIEKIYTCANMMCDTDSTNTELQKNKIKAQNLYEKTTNKLSFSI